MRIFLAGATGMVGHSILCQLVRKYPYANIRACSFSSDSSFLHQGVEYVKADLRSPAEAGKAVAGCDRVIMAALMHGGGSGVLVNNPASQVTENAVLFSRFLETCNNEGVRKMVWIGSATLYQDHQGIISEDELDWNQDPHPAHFGIGWLMRYAEKLCQFWQQNGTMDIITVRAANVYGPYARFDPRSSNFIPAIIRKAEEKMDPFEVWGRPDVIRDVIFSEDFADAVLRLLLSEQIRGGAFNIGSGEKVTVSSVVSHALQAADHVPTEIRYTDNAPTTIPFRVLDCSKVRNATGWFPEHSLETGIKKTVQWWMENKNWWKK